MQIKITKLCLLQFEIFLSHKAKYVKMSKSLSRVLMGLEHNLSLTKSLDFWHMQEKNNNVFPGKI